MSSPAEFAGHSPYTPLAASQRPFTMRSSIAWPSFSTLRAASPTTGSCRMSGYLPARSHAWKNGPQSMNGTSLSSGYLRSAMRPRRFEGNAFLPRLACVLLADLHIIGTHLRHVRVSLLHARQARGHADGA